MNFLAHLYLSGTSDEIKIGNFIGDFVKGKQFRNFEPAIGEGIRLHREIDDFTDQHPVNQSMRRELSPDFRHYSGVVLDVYWDHFLASNWNEYHPAPLLDFTHEIYTLLYDNWEILPKGVQHMLPYMESGNWLMAYADVTGIEQALNGLARRTRFESNMSSGGRILRSKYDFFQNGFIEFFPDLENFVAERNTFFRPT